MSQTQTLAAPEAPAPAGDIVRALRREDLAAIGRLFEAVFYRRADAVPPSQLAHLADIYLDHPWQDAGTPSLVFQSADGAIDGFLGVLPLRLRQGDKRLHGAIAGSLMVRDAARRPMAGARLLRSFLNGPQAIAFGDTTNAVSEGLWRRLGGSTLPLSSMEFLKIVRPARFAASVAVNRLPLGLGHALKPLAIVADAAMRLVRKPVHRDGTWTDATVDDEAFIAAQAELTRKDALALDLEPEAARWLLRQAALKQKHGPLHRRVVRDRAGKLIGAYLIYARRGQPAELLQVIHDARHGDAVLASLGDFADTTGSCAVRGRSQPALMPALFRAGCLLRHRSFTVVDSRDPALIALAETASLGGFFGETWTRLVSDDFTRDAQQVAIAVPAALQPAPVA